METIPLSMRRVSPEASGGRTQPYAAAPTTSSRAQPRDLDMEVQSGATVLVARGTELRPLVASLPAG
ncbi:hypothetical protein [Rubricoccus marinus]|uniref:hypothetical protein n=1 Tax=Rubricoccus marinus TaxID=716817 RepID=UPI00117A9BF4|nr:hypothetical protein [Rubricoccus marinus]